MDAAPEAHAEKVRGKGGGKRKVSGKGKGKKGKGSYDGERPESQERGGADCQPREHDGAKGRRRGPGSGNSAYPREGADNQALSTDCD